jgi:hypothetical protein
MALVHVLTKEAAASNVLLPTLPEAGVTLQQGTNRRRRNKGPFLSLKIQISISKFKVYLKLILSVKYSDTSYYIRNLIIKLAKKTTFNPVFSLVFRTIRPSSGPV